MRCVVSLTLVLLSVSPLAARAQEAAEPASPPPTAPAALPQEAEAAPARPDETEAGATDDLPELDVDQDYDGLLRDALRRLVQRDAAGAERLLRAAADRDSARPEAYCHLGDAQRVAGRLEDAVLSYQSCTRFADSAGDAMYARIGRSNEALTLERLPGRREQARAVYETLKATEDPAESYAWTLASERLKALAAAGLLETVYAPVRERIEAREAKGEK